VAAGPRPYWLLKDDVLVEDGNSGMLLLGTILSDANGEWGRQARRPPWLRACLAANWAQVRQHGHAFAIRWRKTKPQLVSWERKLCEKERKVGVQCENMWERENINWEKHLQIAEYLTSTKRFFSHIMMLDADACMVRPESDSMGQMAAALEVAGKDLFLTNEDWLKNGEGRINGGLLFAKNSPFTQNLFQDTFEAHTIGPGVQDRGLEHWRIGLKNVRCGGNEQQCLNSIQGNKEFYKYAMVSSGLKYNRGGCLLQRCGEPTNDPPKRSKGLDDPDLEIMHFMGASKHGAQSALCRGWRRQLRGGGEPSAYGCK